jgi:hypothetical protein
MTSNRWIGTSILLSWVPLCLASSILAATSSPSVPGDTVGQKPGIPVTLLTGNPLGGSGCYTDAAQGTLTVDATYGTAITDTDVGGGPSPVMWRLGYTARRVNDHVVVSDPNGLAVATTGHAYRLAGGYVSIPSNGHVFYACDSVTPQ